MDDEIRVVIGMDPHKRSVTIEVMTGDEQVLGGGRFATDVEGFAAMLGYVAAWPNRVGAIEGCEGIGRHVAQRLLAQGEKVVDVPAKLSARVRVFATGQGRKTDNTDAHSIALVGVRMHGLRTVVDDEQLELLRLLVDRRRRIGEEHTRMVCQLHQLLLELIPGGAKRDLSAAQARKLLTGVRPRDVVGKTRKQHAMELVVDLERIYQRKKAANKELIELIKNTGTGLLDLHGIGPSGAARLLVEVGDITRFPDRGHFASWTGTAPIDASSGDRVRHRLSRGGNRQINVVQHTDLSGGSRRTAAPVSLTLLVPLTGGPTPRDRRYLGRTEPGPGCVTFLSRRQTVSDATAPAAAPAVLDPVSIVRSRAYLSALVLAALLGVPISAVAYGFLALVGALQRYLFEGLPADLFDGAAPAWWPVPWLALCGLLVALTIRHLPGPGGHSPALGFSVGGGPPVDRHLPGVVLASLATLSLGAVLGPEAPLIAIGSGLAALTVRLVREDATPMALTVMASAGSFAAVSTLLGSPLLGAFLIMEAAGIAGATLSLVALPGLLASGIGALVFLGLDTWTGLGTFSLALTSVPPGVDPTLATLLWAVPVGLLGALLGWAVRWVGLSLRPLVHRNRVPVTVVLGLLIGLTAMAYQLITAQGFTDVLFSGQDALPALVANAADYSVATLVVLGLCKLLAYGLSLSAFRGGPVFPAMFVGAVLGIALSGLPGMSLAPAIGMGIGAMCCAMLRLPLTSVLLATLLLGSDGLQVTPEVIVAVVVAFVVTTVLPTPGPRQPVEPAVPAAPAAGTATGSAAAEDGVSAPA